MSINVVSQTPTQTIAARDLVGRSGFIRLFLDGAYREVDGPVTAVATKSGARKIRVVTHDFYVRLLEPLAPVTLAV